MDSNSSTSGQSPDRPVFVPNAPDPQPVNRRRSSCLGTGCIGTTLVAVVGFVVAVGIALLILREVISKFLVPTVTQFTATVVAAPQAIAALGSMNAQGMFKDLGPSIAEAMLLSWGIDRAAENARRLQYLADSLEEHERLHGHPPASLDQLTILAGDRTDVWGVAVEYRQVGSPPRWQIRSAGRDRQFDQGDPWLPER